MNTQLICVGEISFNFLIVTPFEHPNLSKALRDTFWKSTAVIGIFFLLLLSFIFLLFINRYLFIKVLFYYFINNFYLFIYFLYFFI